jgi:RHS repeat-associated protein
VARILVSATGGPLADVEVSFLHNDAAGSPVAATSAAGAVKWSRGYQPYGEFSSQTGTAADTRQFFHCKPLDGESRLQYFGARYYDPLLGRFMAIDPAPWNEANLHSFNRYAFANNNPARFTDPDGNSPVDLLFLAYDLGKFGYAVYRGDGVKDAAIDVGLSLVGVLSPVPGAGQVLKAGRVVNEAKVATKAADNVWNTLRGVESATAHATSLPRSSTPSAHSVLFETTIAKTGKGERTAHKAAANKELNAALAQDKDVAQMMSRAGVTPTAGSGTPTGYQWHHAQGRPGVMQLVPESQHSPGSAFQDVLHRGGKGGYSEWGKGW